MLTKANTHTPYLKPSLSTFTFIFPKKQSLQTTLSFAVQRYSCKHSMARDSGEAEKVYRSSVIFP